MKIKHFLPFIALISFTIACAAPQENTSATPTAIPAIVSDIATPTATPLPPTVTAIPAATKTPTVVISPIETIAATSAPLSPTATPYPTPSSAAKQPKAIVSASSLNVRSGPGIIYTPLSVLSKNESVAIMGINATDEWYQVARAGNIIGWISASPKYVETTPLVFDVPLVAAPPIDGGGNTFILQPETGGEIYLFNTETESLEMLTQGIDPALSPDGTQIAFTRWGSGKVGTLWLYDLSTRTERQLLGEMIAPKSPSWSPNGRELVISHQKGGRLTIESRCLSMGQDGSFPFPPDGAYNFEIVGFQLCFKMTPDPHWQLRRISATDGTFEDLPSQTYALAPTWDTAKSWRIIFASSIGLQQLDLNRGEYFPFADNFQDRAPIISPAGSAVAISHRQHDHWEIYTIDTADGTRHRLTPSENRSNSAAPAWSPNGKQIAFVSDRGGKWEFWVMNANGTDPHPLLPADVAQKLTLQYHGVDERLISWGK